MAPRVPHTFDRPPVAGGSPARPPVSWGHLGLTVHRLMRAQTVSHAALAEPPGAPLLRLMSSGDEAQP
jgi:hypothetical protein